MTRSLTLGTPLVANTDMWFALVNPLTSGDNTMFVDKVQLTAVVPEPSGWILLAIGLAGFKGAARRKKISAC